MTLELVEQAIYDLYHYFYREAPGVAPVEQGQLGWLWQQFDYLMQQEHPSYGN